MQLVETWKKSMNTETQKTTLDRRVPTRWNSDFACLVAHVFFKTPVQLLTSNTALDLEPYKLSDSQWSLAETLSEVLDVSIIYLK